MGARGCCSIHDICAQLSIELYCGISHLLVADGTCEDQRSTAVAKMDNDVAADTTQEAASDQARLTGANVNSMVVELDGCQLTGICNKSG
jgi:hypothetical protein